MTEDVKNTFITIKLDKDLRKKVKLVAEKEDRSTTSLVRWLLHKYTAGKLKVIDGEDQKR